MFNYYNNYNKLAYTENVTKTTQVYNAEQLEYNKLAYTENVTKTTQVYNGQLLE